MSLPGIVPMTRDRTVQYHDPVQILDRVQYLGLVQSFGRVQSLGPVHILTQYVNLVHDNGIVSWPSTNLDPVR